MQSSGSSVFAVRAREPEGFDGLLQEQVVAAVVAGGGGDVGVSGLRLGHIKVPCAPPLDSSRL